jgi:hypothetical protein
MQNAIAFADNDVAVLAWSYGAKIPGCMASRSTGSTRTVSKRSCRPMAVFPGFTPRRARRRALFRSRSSNWKDPYARLVADQTNSRRFRYKFVPLAGQPGSLKPMTVAFLTSNEIEVGPAVAPQWRAIFNRGLISTQRVSSRSAAIRPRASLLAADRQEGQRACA